jgi:succinate dehydrogenase flavoprotein subunit
VSDGDAIRASIDAHETPLRHPPGDLNAIRDGLHACMWDDVGILRTAAGLERALVTLGELGAALARTGIADTERAYNVSWQDWLNLDSLIAVSRVIARAALARADSRGAHFREDFPARGEFAESSYIVVQQRGEVLALTREPVQFTRIAPPLAPGPSQQ